MKVDQLHGHQLQSMMLMMAASDGFCSSNIVHDFTDTNSSGRIKDDRKRPEETGGETTI